MKAHAILVDPAEELTVIEAAEALIRSATETFGGFAVPPQDFYRLARAVVEERTHQGASE
jgi:hypothetical protein